MKRHVLWVLAIGLSIFAIVNSHIQQVTVHRTVAYGLSPEQVVRSYILFQAQTNEQPVRIRSCYTKQIGPQHVAVSCKVVYDGGSNQDLIYDLTHSTWEITPGSQ